MPLPRELLELQEATQEFRVVVVTKPEPFLDYLRIDTIDSAGAKQSPRSIGSDEQIVYAYTDVSHSEYPDFYFYSTHTELSLNRTDFLQKRAESLINPHKLHDSHTVPAVYSNPNLLSVPNTRIETVKTPPDPLYTIHSLPSGINNPSTPTIQNISDAENHGTHITLKKPRGGEIDVTNNKYFPTTIKLQLAEKTSFELGSELQSRVFTTNI